MSSDLWIDLNPVLFKRLPLQRGVLSTSMVSHGDVGVTSCLHKKRCNSCQSSLLLFAGEVISVQFFFCFFQKPTLERSQISQWAELCG